MDEYESKQFAKGILLCLSLFNNSGNILLCPCCGGESEMIPDSTRDPNNFRIRCTECGLATRYMANPEILTEEWNRTAKRRYKRDRR